MKKIILLSKKFLPAPLLSVAKNSALKVMSRVEKILKGVICVSKLPPQYFSKITTIYNSKATIYNPIDAAYGFLLSYSKQGVYFCFITYFVLDILK